VRFVNICLKNQQKHQLFIQFINYVWYLLHVSALWLLTQKDGYHKNSSEFHTVPYEQTLLRGVSKEFGE
jgi:hypothetical protein